MPRPLLGLILFCASLLISLSAVANEGVKSGESVKLKEAEKGKGRELFVKATCWGCHPHGENSLHPDNPLKGPAFQKRYKRDQDIVDFVRRGSPRFGMPPFPKSKLGDEDLRCIIVYIRSLTPPVRSEAHGK